MKTQQILTGQQAVDQYGLNALIECRVAINTEFNGLGHIVMGIGVIADPDNCFIDLSDEPAVLYVEIGQDDDSFLHPIMADEQFVLLDDKNTPPAESNAVLAKRIVELTNELSTANSMHLDNDRYKYEQRGFGCVDDLLLHFDALAAQVEQLKSAYKELAGAINDADDCEDGTPEMEEATGKIFAVMQHGYNTAFRATPAQCLAEIKAQAVIDALNHILSMPQITHQSFFRNDRYMYVSNRALDEYANQIRQQAKPSGTWLKDRNTHCNAKAGA